MIEYKKVDYEFWGKLIGEIESKYAVLKLTTLNFIKKNQVIENSFIYWIKKKIPQKAMHSAPDFFHIYQTVFIISNHYATFA